MTGALGQSTSQLLVACWCHFQQPHFLLLVRNSSQLVRWRSCQVADSTRSPPPTTHCATSLPLSTSLGPPAGSASGCTTRRACAALHRAHCFDICRCCARGALRCLEACTLRTRCARNTALRIRVPRCIGSSSSPVSVEMPGLLCQATTATNLHSQVGP